MKTPGKIGFTFLQQAQQWLRATATILKPRYATDRVVIGATDQGAADSTLLSVDAGSDGSRAIMTRGIIGTSSALVMTESAANLTCAYLTGASGTLSSAGIYVKNNQLVIAHQCGANGQIRFLTITLDGVSCSWVQSATAP